MTKKQLSKVRDAELKSFIKSGGRKNAEADFNTILRRAVKPKKVNKSSGKKK